MANAWNNVTVGATNVTLFKATRMTTGTPGTDIDGATAVAVINTSDQPILLFCRGHHGNPAGTPTPAFPLPAGKSVTFRINDDTKPLAQIDEIIAIRGGGSNAACGGGVVERR